MLGCAEYDVENDAELIVPALLEPAMGSGSMLRLRGLSSLGSRRRCGALWLGGMVSLVDDVVVVD